MDNGVFARVLLRRVRGEGKAAAGMQTQGPDGLARPTDRMYFLKVLSSRGLFGTKNKHKTRVNKKA